MDDRGLDLFRAACGVLGPTCVTRLDGGAVESVCEPGLPYAVVGRGPGADIVLDHEGVSRRHAYLQVLDGRAFWVDLGGRGGVLWPSGRARAGWADGRDGVTIGPFRIVAQAAPRGREPGRAWSPLATATPAAGALPPLPVDLIDGLAGAPSGPRAIGRVVALVGRSPTCHVRLVDRAVASHQAALVRTPDGPWVVDLLGRGGTLVNGISVRHARLRDGDELQFGPYRLRALCDRPAGAVGTGLAPVRAGAGPRGEIGPVVDEAVEGLIDQLGAVQAEVLGQFRGALKGLLGSQDAARRDEIDSLRAEVIELRRLALGAPARHLISGSPARHPALQQPALPAAPPPPESAPEQVQDWLTRRIEAVRDDPPGRLRRVLGTMIGQRRRRRPAGDLP